MSFENKISVGDINYYVGDEIPTFTAPKGSVYIYKNINDIDLLYVNVGDAIWEKCIDSEYSKIYYYGRTAGLDTDLNVWVSMHTPEWTSGLSTDNFILNSAPHLEYTGDFPIKIFATLNTYIVNSEKWMRMESGLSKNLLTPTLYNGSTIPSNTRRRVIHMNSLINLVKGDELLGGIRWTARESGGGPVARTYIPVNTSVEVFKIDNPIIFLKEDWESQGLEHNSWTLANDTTNVWTIGDAENNTTGGSYSIYISNTDGDSASYNETVANISHVWLEVTIPSSAVDVILSFDWKSWAENGAGATNWDYGTVNITDTTPVPGSETHTTLATLDSNNDPTGNGRIGAITNAGKFNLGYGGADNLWRTEGINLSNYIGQTKKLVFSWVNDDSVGNNPPFVLDNINIYIY